VLDNSRIASAQRNWSLAGLGSANSLRPYPDTLHRGYGWGRMLDSDDFSWPIIAAFHSEAAHITKPMKDRLETQHPPTWH